MAQLADNNALLIYRVGPVLCSAPTLPIDALIPPPSLTRPPGSSESHPGIFRHDGKLVRLTDLRQLFGVEQQNRNQPGRIIVCQLDQHYTGFLVDEVIDVIKTPTSGWGQLSLSLSGGVFSKSLLLEEKIYLYTEFEKLHQVRNQGFLKPWIEQLQEQKQQQQQEKTHSENHLQQHEAGSTVAAAASASASSASQQAEISPTAAPDSNRGSSTSADRSQPQKKIAEHNSTTASIADTAHSNKADDFTPTIMPAQNRQAAQSPQQAVKKHSALASQCHPDKTPANKHAHTTPGKDQLTALPTAKSNKSVTATAATTHKVSVTASPSGKPVRLKPQPQPQPHRLTASSGELKPAITTEHKSSPDKKSSASSTAPAVAHRHPTSNAASTSTGLDDNNSPSALFLFIALFIAIGLISTVIYLWPDQNTDRTKTSATTVANISPTHAPPIITQSEHQPETATPVAPASHIPSSTAMPPDDLPASKTSQPPAAQNNESSYHAAIEQQSNAPGSNEITIILSAPANDEVIRSDTDLDASSPVTTVIQNTSDQTETDTELAVQAPMIITHPPLSNSARIQHIDQIVHTVIKGDTLWHIAQRYIHNPYRYPELARLNKIHNPDLIYPGDQVRIIRIYQKAHTPPPAK